MQFPPELNVFIMIFMDINTRKIIIHNSNKEVHCDEG